MTPLANRNNVDPMDLFIGPVVIVRRLTWTKDASSGLDFCKIAASDSQRHGGMCDVSVFVSEIVATARGLSAFLISPNGFGVKLFLAHTIAAFPQSPLATVERCESADRPGLLARLAHSTSFTARRFWRQVCRAVTGAASFLPRLLVFGNARLALMPVAVDGAFGLVKVEDRPLDFAKRTNLGSFNFRHADLLERFVRSGRRWALQAPGVARYFTAPLASASRGAA